jgi:hypothetical protein
MIEVNGGSCCRGPAFAWGVIKGHIANFMDKAFHPMVLESMARTSGF